MATAAPSPALAAQARRYYVELVLRELPRTVQTIVSTVRAMMSETTAPDQAAKRRDLVMDLPQLAPRWHQALAAGLRAAAVPVSGGGVAAATPVREKLALSLVDDDSIDIEIVSSRLALALMDKASWEFSDLRFRIGSLERRDELEVHDVLRPHVLARTALDAWRSAGLSLDHWRTAQRVLHEELAGLIQEGYHETNRWLVAQGVCADVNLRPFIRRTRDAGPTTLMGGLQTRPSATGGGGAQPTPSAPAPGGGSAPAKLSTASSQQPRPRYPGPSGSVMQGPLPSGNPDLFAPTEVAGLPGQRSSQSNDQAWAATQLDPGLGGGRGGGGQGQGGGAGGGRSPVYEETRLMTRSPGLLRGSEHAEAVLGRLNKLVSRQVADFAGSTVVQAHGGGGGGGASPGLRAAINDAQAAIQKRFAAAPAVAASAAAAGGAAGAVVSTPALLQEVQQRKQALKQAATTPVERATIEVVALMFQSLLTEERIPTSIRVWFARLQMPVLRVAVAEPDFFATTDHPARKLIDRMGACVMGFEAGAASGVSEPLEKEIKRVVQVVEAYPDTGRRVFQTVLTEFERFLENYFKTEHAASAKGVSLAQQIEQREALAIQYTIELRKMLDQVPVHDGVREFLFHVWADVLATTAVQAGQAGEATRKMHRAAADLIWLASAKVTREERSEAIRRLPPLLKLLREGMTKAGVPTPKQDEYLQSLNNSLAAAFSARTATIPNERLEELMMQLETLEDMLPDVEHLEIDESMVRDLSGFESSDLDVVAEGGSMPAPAMLAWVNDLQTGAWFRLDYRNRIEPVQLAWQGMRKQLNLFVTAQGRGIMFQKYRLAAFMQAGLLVPVEEESLTVRATRDALAKLDADPTRLLN